VQVLPSAGPYHVVSYSAGQAIVLARNPAYPGPRPRNFERVEIELNVSKSLSLQEVESGKADFALDGVPAQAAASLAARYGRKSSTKGPRRFFVDRVLQFGFLALNTSRPLFSDARVRRAVNYAIDRSELTRQATLAGTPEVPTDHYLPPGMPGFVDRRSYPLHALPNRARALLPRGTPRRAVLYTCSDSRCRRQAEIVRQDLAAIGIAVEIDQLPQGVLARRTGRRGEPYDLALFDWFADYLDPADFLNTLLDSGQIKFGVNKPVFDEPAYDRRLRAAASASGPRRVAAYARLEQDLVRRAAPFVAFSNRTQQTLFSDPIGCHVYQPLFGIDLTAVCPRSS
jgi:ABC-type oligopeptide transport system substrate-binding subunit